MPAIRQYTATETVRADDAQASAAAQAGAATAQAYGSIGTSIGGAVKELGGAITQRETNAETSKLSADLATANADLTVEWQKLTQDPEAMNDPELATRFIRDRVEPTLGAIRENLETGAAQNLYERSAAGIRANLFVAASADQSSLAGMAAVHQANTVVNQVSSAAMANPAGFEGNLALLRTSIDGLSGIDRMAPAARAKMLEEGESAVAFATVRGMAQRNPAAARQEIESGRFNTWLDANKQAQLRNYADEIERDQKNQAAADEAARIKANKAQADTFANQITASMIGDDGSIHVGPETFAAIRSLTQMPDVEPSLGRAMRSMALAATKADPPLSDPGTYLDFLDRLGRGDVPMQEIFQARGESRLNNKDFSFMMQWAKSLTASPERRTQQQTLNTFFGGMKAYITKSNMLVSDADGNQRYSEYVRDHSARYWDGLAKGRTSEDMFKEFQADVPQYQQPMARSQERMIGGIRFPNAPLPPSAPGAATVMGAAASPHLAPPRAKGENAASYLARTQGQKPAPAPAAAAVVPGAGGTLDEPEEETDGEDGEE